eukprot:1005297-Rhodomonas_salina.1
MRWYFMRLRSIVSAAAVSVKPHSAASSAHPNRGSVRVTLALAAGHSTPRPCGCVARRWSGWHAWCLCEQINSIAASVHGNADIAALPA